MRHLLPWLSPLFLLACGPKAAAPVSEHVATTESRDDLLDRYAPFAVKGSFILHDLGRDHWVLIDSAQADLATLPASSFKIFSSLYALESGLVKGADEVFTWDGNDYGREAVNRDLTLAESMRLSAYWVHRDIARRAGPDALKHWLDSLPYGNADTSGGYDRCWVAGGLQITPREQVYWLGDLLQDCTPFSQRSITELKGMILQEDTLGHRVYAKTGWVMGDFGSVGWYVGWVEKNDGSGPYVFANRVITADTLSETFAPSRASTAFEILKALQVLP
ncbi:MAG: class D beta-lactamase [Flavobacteriales bacterium]|nr:class D beta-lactamase [Flavobacteriales bacterium]